MNGEPLPYDHGHPVRVPVPSPGRVRWPTDWRPPTPGAYTLPARGTHSAGRTQPYTTVHNTQGHLFDAVVRHPVKAV
ncbi:hypothetical protein [Streptomyces sp. NPDC096132]|uniref:hypothetical protein n=1 Tax=Streptomyces sp. NPDC096132 TaxID=3366075 RepID=UPI0038300023